MGKREVKYEAKLIKYNEAKWNKRKKKKKTPTSNKKKNGQDYTTKPKPIKIL